MVKEVAEKFNTVRRVHQRHRQTDDRQTDGLAMITRCERNVVKFV